MLRYFPWQPWSTCQLTSFLLACPDDLNFNTFDRQGRLFKNHVDLAIFSHSPTTHISKAESLFSLRPATTRRPRNQRPPSKHQDQSSHSVTMSLPYRGHGTGVLHQAFNISCFAGNTLLRLVGCPTVEDCERYGCCPGPTNVRSTASRLIKKSDTLPQQRSLERTPCAFLSTRSSLEVDTDGDVEGSNTNLSDETGKRLVPSSLKTHFMSLPAEVRAMILRHLLGDRKVHAHYKQQVTCDSEDPMSEVSTAIVVVILFIHI